MELDVKATARREPWNKGKIVGQKAPLRLKDIWAIRVPLQLAQRTRELALFNLAVDSKLRSCHARGARRCSCNRHAAEDSTARAVRDY